MKSIVVIGLAIVLLLSGCIGGVAPQPRPSWGGFTPGTLDLPATYDRAGRIRGTWETAQLQWSLILDGGPTDNVCGAERLWVWSQSAPNHPGELGDPTIRLFVCYAGTAERAGEYVAATPLDETLVPYNARVYEAKNIDGQSAAVHADQARAACVWGTLDACRGWTFLGSYGQVIVNAQFVAVGQPAGRLDEHGFAALVASVDQNVSAQLDADATSDQ